VPLKSDRLLERQASSGLLRSGTVPIAGYRPGGSWLGARGGVSQPGFVSIRLHRALAPDARFHLINIAEWESVENFVSAPKRWVAELR
jgi:hypothetical protein